MYVRHFMTILESIAVEIGRLNETIRVSNQLRHPKNHKGHMKIWVQID